jgi:6-pyruvoyltetrahydropterin/6-carboxytetrahydropterin synthase
MSITIMRKVSFCAGHRLLNHENKCANVHGHNYLVEFYVTGNEVDEIGRVVDFAVINRLFKGWIDEHWDHGFLLWDEDKEAIAALNLIRPNRLYLLPYNPTAENLARYLLEVVAPPLIASIKGYDLRMSKVVVWETENSSAEVSVDASRHQADALLQQAQRHQQAFLN